jgi:hypothetical protein
MKAQMLKLAGVKTEAAFYKKYPTQEAFMKVHGKAFKKAQIGTYIGGEAAATPKPINFNDAYDQTDLSITGKTNAMRQEEMYKQAALAADQKQAQGGGDMFSQIGGAVGQLGQLFGGEGEEAEYGAYIPKAQFGNMFKGFNPGNTQVPSGIGYSPMSTNLTSSGFQMPSAAKSFASNNPLPAGVPNVGNPQSGMMDKIGDAVGKYAAPAGQIIQGIGALKAQRNALKQAKQTRQVSDLALQASNTRPEQSQRRYVRPEDMVTSGNQVGFTQGTGTNILAQGGIKIPASGAIVNKGKIKKELNKPKNPISTLPEQWDVRDSKDVINLPSYLHEWDTNTVRTTSDAEYKALKSNLGKLNKKAVEMESAKNFIDWYENPKTAERFPKNSGMDPRRLQDFMGKALRTPIEQYSEYVDHYAPMPTFTDAQFSSPGIAKANYDNPQWHNTGFITYREGVDSEALEHERVHSSGLDLALAPALYEALGKSMPSGDKRGDLSYMDQPEEMYANFHHFRRNLGFKPGEKTTADDLLKRYKKATEEAEKSGKSINKNIWRELNIDGYDEKTQKFKHDKKQLEKLAKAINTVAYNPNTDEDVTYAKDGAEIQNTYAPGTLYDDLGYEPLNDSDEVKQYANGGFPWDIAGNIGSNIGGAIVGQDAGSQIGGTLGGTLGTALGGPLGGAIGKTLGTVAGGLLDTTDRKMKKEQAATDRNMQAMAFGQGAQSLQAQNSAVMEDGGYVSHDWTPQLITKFGDYDLEDLLAPDETMDTLRAGGHLRAYKEPSERAMQTFAMGGELQTHWGGHMEEMSQNPYLPGDGITYMPHGQSHDETNSKGQSGIGITYGGNSKGEYGLSMAENGFIPEEAKNGGTLVEVERREPIMKLRDGSTGEDNLVVFGNLEIPKYGVELLGDKKAKGMKFKNYVADLSKSETKQNKTIQKSAEKLADFDPKDSFDKLKFAGLQANILGGNMKLKEIAQTKEKAAALQNAINDTAEEMGFDADSLAKGRVKMAKYGGEFSMAQKGKKVKGKNVKTNVLPKFKKPDIVDNMEIPSIPKLARTEAQIAADEDKYSRMQSGIVGEDYDDMIKVSPISDDVLNPKKETVDLNPYVNAINSVIPTLRPSNAEELDGRQLYGEMYALSQNQEEPVQAQQFSPQLANTYSISLQDQMNEITAQTRAAQRMAQNNPAAQAAIAAQAYEAINKVKGEEFRMNQGLANQVQTANIAAMNDAQLKNLGILDQQYTRQAQARSNTKAVAQAALNSISDKYAKNSLENRTLQTYENMYNYRYDKAGRLINMNPLAQWDVSGLTSGKSGAKDLPEGYEYIYDKNSKPIDVRKTPKEKAKNGSIVKAIRNL